MIAPAGPVYQAGTLSGNPLAMAAGLATLKELTDEAYASLERISAALETRLHSVFGEAGVPATIQRVGSMLTVFFTDQPVHNMEDASRADHSRFAAFFRRMLARGIHLPPSGYEAWFVSLAHDESVVERTAQAAEEALAG